MIPDMALFRARYGKPAHGHRDTYDKAGRLKVSVAWDRWVLEAINRRVVRNKSTFAQEARRLIDIGLRMDHFK